MSPAYIDHVSYQPQYVEAAPAMYTDKCLALYKKMADKPIDSLLYEPQWVDIATSTYLVMKQDVLAETPQAMQAVRALYQVEDKLRNVMGGNNEPLPYTEGVWKLLIPKKGFSDHLNIQGNFMLRQGYSVHPEELEQAKQELATQQAQNAEFLALLPYVQLEKQTDGPSICMLHVGPYSAEGESFKRMTEFARERGWKKRGEFHREVYLRDAQVEQDAKNFHTILYMFVTKI